MWPGMGSSMGCVGSAASAGATGTRASANDAAAIKRFIVFSPMLGESASARVRAGAGHPRTAARASPRVALTLLSPPVTSTRRPGGIACGQGLFADLLSPDRDAVEQQANEPSAGR